VKWILLRDFWIIHRITFFRDVPKLSRSCLEISSETNAVPSRTFRDEKFSRRILGRLVSSRTGRDETSSGYIPSRRQHYLNLPSFMFSCIRNCIFVEIIMVRMLWECKTEITLCFKLCLSCAVYFHLSYSSHPCTNTGGARGRTFPY